MADFAHFALTQRLAFATLLLAVCVPLSRAVEQARPGAPTDPKARKTFAVAIAWQNQGQSPLAIETFLKANEQDGGHCTQCLDRAFALAQEISDFKTQQSILHDELQREQTDPGKATLHFKLGVALQQQALAQKGTKQDLCFNDSCGEFRTALTLDPTFATVHYGLGISLAHLHQDDDARAEFAAFLKNDREFPLLHERAARYFDRVDLARARMAPPFSLTTIDGQHITMDSLAGKVVLIDFWATWCGPCREALPHVREIARKFAGQPFVVLSVSLDNDEAKWRDFVAKNDMTWLQYRDGRFTGPMATRFVVNAIPSTFSIDADGVLKDQHVGDENIEGELKKMIARATELANRQPALASGPTSGNAK